LLIYLIYNQKKVFLRGIKMISHKYKCIFIHIPKCAGTSIESALGHFDNYSGSIEQDHRSIRMIEKPFLTHNIFTSKENLFQVARRIHYGFRKHVNPNNNLTVSKEQYNSYFKFTFVRNPWARAYSWYKNVMRYEINKKELGITKDITFNEFLRRYVGKGGLRPQTYWIKDCSGSIPLEYIGRFENLLNDFSEACKLMGIEPIMLPHKIKGLDGDYRGKYEKESIDIIKEIYKEEIALFKYSFGE